MKVFTCNEFQGYWPVGSAAVVAAEDINDAAARLTEALAAIQLPQTVLPEQMIELVIEVPVVRILADGNY